MQILHPAFLQVREFFLHPLQGPSELLRVHHHSYHPVGMMSFRILQTALIKISQTRLAVAVSALQHAQEEVERLLIIVDAHVEAFELLHVRIESFSEYISSLSHVTYPFLPMTAWQVSPHVLSM